MCTANLRPLLLFLAFVSAEADRPALVVEQDQDSSGLLVPYPTLLPPLHQVPCLDQLPEVGFDRVAIGPGHGDRSAHRQPPVFTHDADQLLGERRARQGGRRQGVKGTEVSGPEALARVRSPQPPMNGRKLQLQVGALFDPGEFRPDHPRGLGQFLLKQ